MRHMQKGIAGIVLGISLLGWCPPSAWAQDPIHKLGRGAGNVLTCWIEILKNLHLGLQEDNPVKGAAVGLFKGGGLALTRLVVGAYETVSFPIPYPKEYASPYEGMELPDYAWQ